MAREQARTVYGPYQRPLVMKSEGCQLPFRSFRSGASGSVAMRKANERAGMDIGAFFASIMLLIPVMPIIMGFGGSILIDNECIDPEVLYNVEASGNDPFIENKGQWNEDLRFVAGTSFGSIGIGDGCIYYYIDSNMSAPTLDEGTGYVVKVAFIGSEGGAPIGSIPLATRYNYFIGNDKSGWATDVESYSSVVHEGVWAGVDLVYHNDNGKLKYDLILDAGADPADVRIKVDGIRELKVVDGSLYMVLDDRTVLTDSSLKVYYQEDGGIIDADFWVDGNTYGFMIGEHDSTKALVIDPEVNLKAVNFSTYIGGSGMDSPQGTDIDQNGDIFICGYTLAEDFPVTPGAYQVSKAEGWGTAFVLKLSSDGSTMKYCTYIGGSESSIATDIHATPTGSVVVVGYTGSRDFPVTMDAYDDSLDGGYDDFVLELGPTGSTLKYSTYIGGEQNEGAPEMDIDGEGKVFVISNTNSTKFPVTGNAYQSSLTSGQSEDKMDLCLFVLDLSEMDLSYSTYLGGNDWEVQSDIICGSSGMVHVCGYTLSTDFDVTTSAYSVSQKGSWDGFIVKMNTTSGDLVLGTFFGGSKEDVVFGMDVDRSGNIYACGQTLSTDLPVTASAYDKKLDGELDGFIMVLNSSGRTLDSSTYLGGTDHDSLTSLELDPMGYIHAVGETWSTDLPVQYKAFMTEYSGNGDSIYVKLSSDLSSLKYVTYLGGSGAEGFSSATMVTIDGWDGTPIASGCTYSSNFPVTPGSFDTSYDIISSDGDVFVTKLYPELPPGLPVVKSIVSGDSFVNLTWEIPVQNQTVPVLDFEILRGTVKGLLEVIGRSGTELFYNDTIVTNGITYRYAVRGTNEMGPGLTSPEVVARPGTRPTAPRNLTAEHGDATAVLSWDAPEKDGGWKVLEYQICRMNLSAGGDTTIITDVRTDIYTDNDVVNGIGYTYTLRAENELGTSEASKPITVVPMTVPDAPRDLKISYGPGYSLLEWKLPIYDGGDHVTAFRVYRMSEDDWTPIKDLPGEIMALNDTGLTNGRVYNYRVTALNSEGESEPSNEVQSYPFDVPSCPTSLKAEAYDGSIVIKWEAPASDGGSPVKGYSVFRSNGDDWKEVHQVLENIHSFTDRSVENGRTYRYRVNAWNIAGTSPYSNEVDATPLGCPSAPSGITGKGGDGFATISWVRPYDGGAGITTYSVQRRELTGGYVPYAKVTESKLEFNDTEVTNGIKYYYRVSAINQIGSSGFSDEIAITPAGLSDPPTGLVLNWRSSSIFIEWVLPKDTGGLALTGTRVYKGTSSGALSLLIELGRGSSSYLDKNIMNRTTYHYAVSSLNPLGESVMSEIRTIIISTTPDAPSNLTAVAGDGKIELTWGLPVSDGEADILEYKVHRLAENDQWRTVAKVGGNILNWTDTDVEVGMTYTYKVRALNERGDGPFSSTVEVEFGNENNDGSKGANDGTWTIVIVLLSSAILIALAVTVTIVMVKRARRTTGPVENPKQVQE